MFPAPGSHNYSHLKKKKSFYLVSLYILLTHWPYRALEPKAATAIPFHPILSVACSVHCSGFIINLASPFYIFYNYFILSGSWKDQVCFRSPSDPLDSILTQNCNETVTFCSEQLHEALNSSLIGPHCQKTHFP